MKLSFIAPLIAAAMLVVYGQQAMPRMSTVEPANGKAGDVVTVAHAWAQAAAYRYAANTSALDDRTTVESIAVLLPVAPTGTARSFLEHVAADCFEVELIYPHGETFRHEQLT